MPAKVAEDALALAPLICVAPAALIPTDEVRLRTADPSVLAAPDKALEPTFLACAEAVNVPAALSEAAPVTCPATSPLATKVAAPSNVAPALAVFCPLAATVLSASKALDEDLFLSPALTSVPVPASAALLVRFLTADAPRTPVPETFVLEDLLRAPVAENAA